MTYATQQNLVDRFGQQEITELTDRANAGAIDAAVVAKALADADGEINGYLSSRYTLPITPVPTVLERWACEIARYYLYEDRVTEQVKRRYDDVINSLKAVARGTMSLGPDADGDAVATLGGPQTSAPDRIFTQDTLCDY
jgi:phage gp36-like protein